MASSYLMLRLDPAQWTVNAMAMPIMLVPEIGNLIKTFGKMDAVKAKRLVLLCPLLWMTQGQGCRPMSKL